MIEPGIYKDVMSSFPSGVTVVTTLDPERRHRRHHRQRLQCAVD
jgi:flavin reductase (DIM6/NTAB) family NADH-FMN oxidoreductase RutF